MTYTDATAAELRRAVLFRCDELQDAVGHLRGPLGRSRSFLRTALDLIDEFPAALRAVVAQEWDKNADPAARSQILTALLRHANFVADFLEKHLAHGTRRELSEALVDEIHRELDALGLSQYGVVISHGEAYNFLTTYGDLRAAVFSPLASAGTYADLPRYFALFQVPRIEGTGVQWRPVLLGHEVAHVAVREKEGVTAYDVWSKFDVTAAGELPNPHAAPGSAPFAIAMGLYRIAQAWATELLCDAHALHRFGPAAVAALGEYLYSISAPDMPSPTHPPGHLRLRLLLAQLGAVTDPRSQEVVRPWADLTPPAPAFAEPWAQHLSALFMGDIAGLSATAAGFGAPGYSHGERGPVASVLADALKDGIPGREIALVPPHDFVTPVDADVVNAVWMARVEGATVPFDTLGKKAIEGLEFVRRWVDRKGEVPLDLYSPEAQPDPLPGEIAIGSLSEDQICQRLRVDDDRRLVAQPLVHRPKGAGLDLRLGNRFIVFRRTGTATFDPLELKDDPRSIQVHLELAWSEQFVLHPQELVLGATLEYLVIPPDLTGQVVTRSSYGRLGLLTATAVQIHPRFHGCLTLELVNLSTIPITLTPGERIAQLVLNKTKPVSQGDDKYTYPIGPQFSRVRDDPEADVLRGIRES